MKLKFNLNKRNLTAEVVGYELDKGDKDLHLVIPEYTEDGEYKVTSIASYALAECQAISKVILPMTMTSIGQLAFYNCKNLSSVTLPRFLKSIGFAAFFGCSKLVMIYIPDNVIVIGDSAFENCCLLQSVRLSANIRRIGAYAFSKCYSLASFYVPFGDYKCEHHAIFQSPKIEIRPLELYNINPELIEEL